MANQTMQTPPTEEQKPKEEKDITKKYQALLDLANSRLTLAKESDKKYREAVEKWLKDYEIESMDDMELGDLHNKLQVPYIFSTVESNLPSIFETIPSIMMKQRGKLDKEFTEFANAVWLHVSERINLEETIENGGFMFLNGGEGHFKYGWRLETETVEEEEQVAILNETGEQVSTQVVKKPVEVPVVDLPYVKELRYDKIFFSDESKFVVDDKDNLIPYVICQETMSKDEAEYQYNTKFDDIGSYMDVSKINSEWSVDGGEIEKVGIKKSDLKRIDVFEYYGTLPKTEAKDPNWKPWKVYFFSFCKSKMLTEPTTLKKKPINSLGNYGSPIKFHRFGEPKVLRELEQDISLGRSTIADYRDRIATKIALPITAEVDEYNLKSPKLFTIVRYSGQEKPEYISTPSIPEAVMTGIDQSRQDISMASAQLDVSRGGTSSVVDTATGQKIFDQAQGKRIERKRKKIGKVIRSLAINILQLCAENWDVETFAKIVDMEVAELQQLGFVEKLKEIGEVWDVVIDLESVTDNKAAMSAQAIALYRETKDDQYANHEEILKEVIKIGFGQKDYDRFLSNNVTPEQAIKAVEFLAQNGLMSPEIAQQMVMFLQQMMMAQQGGNAPGNGVGRPPVKSPTEIVEKSAPGADGNQIASQNAAAYKQTGVSKGIQGV